MTKNYHKMISSFIQNEHIKCQSKCRQKTKVQRPRYYSGNCRQCCTSKHYYTFISEVCVWELFIKVLYIEGCDKSYKCKKIIEFAYFDRCWQADMQVIWANFVGRLVKERKTLLRNAIWKRRYFIGFIIWNKIIQQMQSEKLYVSKGPFTPAMVAEWVRACIKFKYTFTRGPSLNPTWNNYSD